MKSLFMRKLLLLLFLFLTFQMAGQNTLGRPFFTGEVNFSLGVNEYYTIEPNDGEPLIVPSGLFLRFSRNGIGWWCLSKRCRIDHYWF